MAFKVIKVKSNKGNTYYLKRYKTIFGDEMAQVFKNEKPSSFAQIEGDYIINNEKDVDKIKSDLKKDKLPSHNDGGYKPSAVGGMY